MRRSWSHNPSHEFQRLVWFTFSFFRSLKKKIFFQYPSMLGYWALSFMIFFAFLFIRLFRYHILGHELVKLTYIDTCFFFFSSFTFYHLVCLRVKLHCFIRFLYAGLSRSWFGVLTRVVFFILFWNWCFFPVYFSIFVLLVIERHISFIFLFMR